MRGKVAGLPLAKQRVGSAERQRRAAVSDNGPKSSEKGPGFFANTLSIVHKNEFLKIFKAT